MKLYTVYTYARIAGGLHAWFTPTRLCGGKRFGVLTKEKVRKQRVRMMETVSFHDYMYHSAIASHPASVAPGDDSKH
uniref:Uncharacterized protein n=1 Tax=Oryza punctata TaxID=4537 RepID=A0A0E0KGB4_ORYPU